MLHKKVLLKFKSLYGNKSSMNRLVTLEEPSSHPRRCRKRYDAIKGFINRDSVGAELGVFKGSFIEYLLSNMPKKIYLVDPWYRLTPSWRWASGDQSTINALVKILNVYSDEISTGILEPRVEFSEAFLASLPNNSLDWVYIDTSHSYEQTLKELTLSIQKVRPKGFIIGDDYYPNPKAQHHGVFRAVKKLTNEGKLELLVTECDQFVAQQK